MREELTALNVDATATRPDMNKDFDAWNRWNEARKLRAAIPELEKQLPAGGTYELNVRFDNWLALDKLNSNDFVRED
ncbi:hypothetical protein ACIOJE_00930 [Kitasatospora sp. NPDC087861]|uniref:hypothetical protein n=1 Tax=Kitasatospora sp. NPDC087861 TaxID=3364070 RepID=UPI0038251AB9